MKIGEFNVLFLLKIVHIVFMKKIIESAWDDRSLLELAEFKSKYSDTINQVMADLDAGKIRVADNSNAGWQVNEWIKKAILLYFKISDSLRSAPGELLSFDKVPLKCHQWTNNNFLNAGFRLVPGAIVRYASFISRNVVLMPSFVNVGAFIGEGTMIDTWVNIGSCAQIGSKCHISVGVGIGGVLEPIQANPVIIEDDVFIGASSQIVEGVIIGEGSVIGMGTYIGASTKIFDKLTGIISYGKIPPYSVVVPGTVPSSDGKVQLNAAIIIKKVDKNIKAKTSINDWLRYND